MATDCSICKRADCDDDCGERALIYREHHRLQMLDIDIDTDHTCMQCNCPVDQPHYLCFTCEHGPCNGEQA